MQENNSHKWYRAGLSALRRLRFGRKLLFPVLAVLALSPWPVAYAYDAGTPGAAPATVSAAPAEAAPAWTTYGRAIGGVDRPGDLFYIDLQEVAADATALLYITNTDELAHQYRYLTLRVGLYAYNAETGWEPLAEIDSNTHAATYITLQNGYIGLALPGLGLYKVTIDGGCFSRYQVNAEGSASPEFYLSLD